MKKLLTWTLLCAFAGGLCAMPVMAQEKKTADPETRFKRLDKNADGKLERWAFEAGTPSGMIRNGYKPSLLPNGTEVTIRGFHAKDPTQNVGKLQQLTTADGKHFGMFGPQEGPGAQ